MDSNLSAESSSALESSDLTAPEPNWQAAVTAGMIAALAGAAIWAGVTYLLEVQIGWMAIGVGAFVGFAIRHFGRGREPRFGFLGAGLALGGVLAGNIFTVIAVAAHELEVGFFELLGSFDWTLAPQLIVETSGPIDLLLYGPAIWEGYKFAIAPSQPEEVRG